jgi:1-acyl-sn-glycerol-3-phosphate acyltransferase
VLAFLTLAAVAASLLHNWRRSGRSFGSFVGLGAVRLYARLWHGCSFARPAPVPRTGGALLVVNHTSSPDGCFVQCGCARALTFLVAQEFFKPRLLWIWATTGCVPVNRLGCDIRAVRQGLRRLQEGRVVVVFPEGTLSGAGLGRPRAPRAGAAFLALHTDVPVFPAFISGGPQHPDVTTGWFCPSRKRVRITYGKPIDMSPYHGRPITRPLIEEVMSLFMRRIADLDPGRARECS